MMERLILFDIDGTLTRTQNGYRPFNEAIFKTFGITGDIRSVVPDGNTDPLIVREIFAQAAAKVEIGENEWRDFAQQLRECYTKALRQGSTIVRPLPGALELVTEIAKTAELSQGVVTGNVEVMAQVKLQAAGLDGYICCGAYGSDSHDRSDLPAIAKQRWEKMSSRTMRSEQCVIVGDTPKDFEAARRNGMKCVLVGTGRYPVEELAYLGPDACLADLTDTKALIELFAGLV